MEAFCIWLKTFSIKLFLFGGSLATVFALVAIAIGMLFDAFYLDYRIFRLLGVIALAPLVFGAGGFLFSIFWPQL